MANIRRKLIDAIRRAVEWGERRVPWGVRSVLGLLCIAGGIVGFLPILGFWMIPVGVALIALDIPPLRRRLLAWVRRHGEPDDRGSAIRPQTRTYDKPDASGR